jgi:hypothetical protein
VKAGARGQIRTDTGDALDVGPLLLGYTSKETPPAGLYHRLGSRMAGPFELHALGGVKWFAGSKFGERRLVRVAGLAPATFPS